jgi:thiol-disulfide isomerase/thioredoxin/glutaredoxin
MIRVELYRKPEDAASDAARATLASLGEELGFDLAEVDVTRDEARRRFERDVPVVFVDGHAVAWGARRDAELRRRVADAVREAVRRREGAPPAAPVPRNVKLAIAAAVGAAVLAALAWQAWRAVGSAERERAAPLARLERVFGIDRASAAGPPIELPTLDGGRFSLAQARGQVVFVNFWATWCPPCREEMPSMLRLGQELERLHPGKFKMVAVSVDDTAEVVREFFGGRPPAGPSVALDSEQLVTRAYYCAARGGCPESYKFPETYIVDQTGRLVAYIVGPRDWSMPEAREFLERLIGS